MPDDFSVRPHAQQEDARLPRRRPLIQRVIRLWHAAVVNAADQTHAYAFGVMPFDVRAGFVQVPTRLDDTVAADNEMIAAIIPTIAVNVPFADLTHADIHRRRCCGTVQNDMVG